MGGLLWPAFQSTGGDRGGRDSPGIGRALAANAVKGIHTVIFAALAASVIHVFAAGVLNRRSRLTGPAIALVLGEAAIFFGNGWRCPLTGLAESIGAESGRVTDILLPRWFADRIPQIFTPPFVVGLLLLIWRRLRR